MPTRGTLLPRSRAGSQRVLWALVAALLGAIPLPLSATTVERMSAEQLVQRSDVIARVVVESSRSEWRERRMVTLVRLHVDEWMKGGPGDAMTLVLPGGIDVERKLAYTAAGVPTLLPAGTRMFVFGSASRGTPGAFVPTGLAQGMFFVRDAGGASPQVQRSFAGIRFEDGAAASAAHDLPEPESAFRARIAQILAGSSR
jgi:hypothetical protein